MPYTIEYTRRAMRDLEAVPTEAARRIIDRSESYARGGPADVKRLTHAEPGYRLRVGSYRVLFDIVDDVLIIRRVKHRRDAYR